LAAHCITCIDGVCRAGALLDQNLANRWCRLFRKQGIWCHCLQRCWLQCSHGIAELQEWSSHVLQARHETVREVLSQIANRLCRQDHLVRRVVLQDWVRGNHHMGALHLNLVRISVAKRLRRAVCTSNASDRKFLCAHSRRLWELDLERCSSGHVHGIGSRPQGSGIGIRREKLEGCTFICILVGG
jgi:hypothetical protein